ncbi:hypothetical protein SAMN05444162_3550 [Paenibacillaceae bacterium GAS479]|nr:hypothetical protein SAMN05444162_3550 [Paenibacillaceae bacterium GAS479]
MGTKFGNMHVITSDKQAVLTALKEVNAERSGSTGGSTKGLTGFEAILAEAERLRNVYYIVELKPGWISILNDSFEWGTVELIGERLSEFINEPVLTVSYFDDDVAEINLYRNGSLLTGHMWSNGTYELDKKEADTSVLSRHLGHHYLSKLNEILHMDDCEEAITALEELLQVPLWIHSEWLQDMEKEEEEWVQHYERHDFN